MDSEGPASQVPALEELERQLEGRLMEGGMQAPSMPTQTHPLRGLPKELLMRILQLAAHPLSVWAEPADFGLHDSKGKEAAVDQEVDSAPA